MEKFHSFLSLLQQRKKLFVLLLAGMLLLFILLVILLQSSKERAATTKRGPQPSSETFSTLTKEEASSPYTLVYGTLSQNAATIKALELDSGKQYLLGELPLAVKKVTVLSPGTLLYINKTDARDYGQELIRYSIKEGASSVVYTAQPEFGIDEYVISPSKRYIAVFEVRFAPTSSILLGGTTRVYSVDLENLSTKNLIYDDVAGETTSIHFPRAITDSGEVFSDKFLANSGAGWSYGVSVSDFTGSAKEDIASMENGTYGTRPSLSPNGDTLLFAGYDGSKGDGTSDVSGFRRALISPDTIELLDVQTKTRRILPGLSNENTYSRASWAKGSDNAVIFTMLSKDINETGQYIYDLSTGVETKLPVQNTEKVQTAIIASLGQKRMLTATQDTAPSSLGSLGETYENSLKSFAVMEYVSGRTTMLNLPDNLMQFIDVFPSGYFAKTKAPEKVLGSQIYAQEKSIQLKPLYPQRNLPQTREPINSNPPPPPPPPPPGTTPPPTPIPTQRPRRTCDLGIVAQCLYANGVTSEEREFCLAKTNYCAQHLIENRGREQGQRLANSIRRCYEVNSGSGANNSCELSPLYLYGSAGQRVRVFVGTAVSSSDPLYHNGYDVTLLGNGQIEADGKLYESIKYDYTSALRKISPPNYGIVSSREELPHTLGYFGTNLGLNEKETADLIASANANITSPYVFISFFDEETSKNILPLAFDPKPATYINIVFYLRELDEPLLYTPLPPLFPAVPRREGLTAVEISEIVE